MDGTQVWTVLTKAAWPKRVLNQYSLLYWHVCKYVIYSYCIPSTFLTNLGYCQSRAFKADANQTTANQTQCTAFMVSNTCGAATAAIDAAVSWRQREASCCISREPSGITGSFDINDEGGQHPETAPAGEWTSVIIIAPSLETRPPPGPDVHGGEAPEREGV